MSNTNNEPQVLVVSDPKLYEYLYGIIQDAQASGAVVHIVTIFPSKVASASGEMEPFGCNPIAVGCPK